MNDRNRTIQKRYDRVSGIYSIMDRMIKDPWRQELLSSVHGKVLEVGVGTGANLPFYPAGAEVTGIDFSKGMLNQARKKLYQLHAENHIRLIEMDAQDLQFSDQIFDFIVSTCVFCSVPDPIKGLRELGRVCKPDGKILMLEHMRSENKVAGVIMDLLNPLTVRLWGANINRRTLDNIRCAGLTIEENEPIYGTILKKLIVSRNNSMQNECY